MALGAQNTQSSRLGRGLASLIGDIPESGLTLPPEGEQKVLSIEQLQPSPINPRKEFAKEEPDRTDQLHSRTRTGTATHCPAGNWI